MAQINLLKTSTAEIQTPPPGFVALTVTPQGRLVMYDENNNPLTVSDIIAETASFAATSSYALVATNVSSSISGAYAISASYVKATLTASIAETASIAVQAAFAFSASSAASWDSASYAATASYYGGTIWDSFKMKFVDKDSAFQFGRTLITGSRILTRGQSSRWDGIGYSDRVGAGEWTILPIFSSASIERPSNWTKVMVSARNIFALGDNGVLYAAGTNNAYQLGNGTTTDNYVLTPITHSNVYGATKKVVDFIIPSSFAIEVTSTQTNAIAKVDTDLSGSYKYYAWGVNGNGQLGLGSTSTATTPTEITDLAGSDITSWSSNYATTLAVSSSGELLGTGYNAYGQLGDNSTTQRTSFVNAKYSGSLEAVTDAVDVKSTFVSSGTGTTGATTYFINRAREVWAMGYNADYQLTNTTGNKSVAFPILKSSSPSNKLTNIAEIKVATTVCVALDANKTLWGWGYNGYGHLGLGSTADVQYATQIATNVLGFWFSNIARLPGNHLFYTKYDSSKGRYVTYAAGYNAYGELGVASTATQTSFAEVQFPLGEYAVDVISIGSSNDGATPYTGTMFLTNKNKLYLAGRSATPLLLNNAGNYAVAVPYQIQTPGF